jgi:glycosyltransferase involved in cell wall biosynthesis
LLINDFSEDNSKQVIENLKIKDQRILLINNKKNRGMFYSRNIGVLAAKGKYIFALDGDDMFSAGNIFYRIYKEAEKYNYDIIGFKALYGNSYNPKVNQIYDEPFIKKKQNRIVYQPKLHLLSLINRDVHIWGKCIKKKIYKKALNALGKKRYSTIYLILK